MKKMLFAFTLALSVQFSGAQDLRDNLYQTKSFPDASFKKIHAVCNHGDIEVVSGQDKDARVEVYIQSTEGNMKLSREAIQNILNEYYTLELSVSGDVLTAAVKQKRDFFQTRRPISISFRIYAGKEKSNDLETSHGNLRLSGFSGSEWLSTDHGDIAAENISGDLSAKTSHGNILIVSAGKAIDARTDHGDIELRESSGKTTLATSNGNIQIKNVQGTVRADTDHGDVSGDMISGELNTSTSHGNINLGHLSGSISASTDHGDLGIYFDKLAGNTTLRNSGGNIDLQLPKNAGVDLDLRGRNVDVKSISNFSGTQDNESIRGTLNGGGAKVLAKTDKGQVDLAFR